MQNSDTICAVSSPPGVGAVGIIRISGKAAIDILNTVFHSNQPFSQAVMRHGFIMDGGTKLDEVMAVGFEGEKTYTGEPMAEIFPHGGRMPMMQVLSAVEKAGARPAEPGEFTKRAFMNGKMDLSEAEAVMDYIGAVSSLSAKSAFDQLEGALSQKIRGMQNRLTDMLAMIEAGIEYPEEDLEHDIKGKAMPVLAELMAEGRALADSFESGRFLKEGFNVCIIGKPNVGKSSLLNALTGKERAIVTEVEGTTRDIIEGLYDIQGLPVRYFDTAGIRESHDAVEAIGVDRSLSAIEKADLVLFTVDGSVPADERDNKVYEKIKDKKTVLVLNKSDRGTKENFPDIKTRVLTSAVTGEGMEALEQAIYDTAVTHQEKAESIVITNARHAHCLNDYVNSLEAAVAEFESGADLECVSIDIRDAWNHIGEITGETVGEAIIDRIFENFCLGK